jgi:hypothetical protein
MFIPHPQHWKLLYNFKRNCETFPYYTEGSTYVLQGLPGAASGYPSQTSPGPPSGSSKPIQTNWFQTYTKNVDKSIRKATFQ